MQKHVVHVVFHAVNDKNGLGMRHWRVRSLGAVSAHLLAGREALSLLDAGAADLGQCCPINPGFIANVIANAALRRLQEESLKLPVFAGEHRTE